ncbi:MAG: YbhB/YbcL family Raf kinase inhibitor-like protein [Opitutaceae bacterium]
MTAPEPLKPLAGFTLQSPAVAADGILPVEFTGDGKGISPPLEWAGAPAATKSYALIMHHLDPAGQTKWYWTLYNLPADTRSLPKDTRGVGSIGNNSVNRRVGYAPPHSKGPGAKTYVLTLYALSAPLQISTSPEQTNRNVLLAAMKDRVLATAEFKVVYTRAGSELKDETRGEPTPEKSKDKRKQ